MLFECGGDLRSMCSIPTADPAFGSCGFCALARTPQQPVCMLRWATARPELDVRLGSDCTACACLTRLIARGIVGCRRPHNGTSERVARLVLLIAARHKLQQSIAAPCKGIHCRADTLLAFGDDDAQLSGKTCSSPILAWCTGLLA
jgi:hypothetical protein